MSLRNDYMTPGEASLRVGPWRLRFHVPNVFAPEAPPIPLEDDPVVLARLAALMSDHIPPCPTCGGDPNVCRVIGCDIATDEPFLSEPASRKKAARTRQGQGFGHASSSRRTPATSRP